jgi:hypothetical protein
MQPFFDRYLQAHPGVERLHLSNPGLETLWTPRDSRAPYCTVFVLCAATDTYQAPEQLVHKIAGHIANATRPVPGPVNVVLWLNTKVRGSGNRSADLIAITDLRRRLQYCDWEKLTANYPRASLRIQIGTQVMPQEAGAGQAFFGCMDAIAYRGWREGLPPYHPVIKIDLDTPYLGPNFIPTAADVIRCGLAHVAKARVEFAEYEYDSRQRFRLPASERVALVYGRTKREIELNLPATARRPYDEETGSAYSLGYFYLRVGGLDPLNTSDGEHRILEAKARQHGLLVGHETLVLYLPDTYIGTSYRRIELLARQIPPYEIPDRDAGASYKTFVDAGLAPVSHRMIANSEVVRMIRRIQGQYATASGLPEAVLLTPKQRAHLKGYIERCRFNADIPVKL